MSFLACGHIYSRINICFVCSVLKLPCLLIDVAGPVEDIYIIYIYILRSANSELKFPVSVIADY